MLDHFRELEIMRGARCVQGEGYVFVRLPDGGEEEHFAGGGMRGRYPVLPVIMARMPVLPPVRRPWWRRWFGR